MSGDTDVFSSSERIPIRSYAEANQELVKSFVRYLQSRGMSAPTIRSFRDSAGRFVEALRGRDQIAEDYRQMISRIVEEKVLEAMVDPADAIFQPFFQPKHISDEIRKKQTVHERRKFSYAYEDYGCLSCGTTEKPHASLWMCSPCHQKASYRLQSSIRKRSTEDEPETFVDTGQLARAALGPSIKILAAKNRRRK